MTCAHLGVAELNARTAEAFDVVIIGGGPSGLMAAVAARSAGASALVLEKGDKLGRKLGISGGGRCNVTNAKPLDALMRNIPGNGRFLHSALHQFSNTDIAAFFERLGIRLKEEDRGRVFPVSDKAATVVAALVDHVFALGTEVWTDTPVRGIVTDGGAITGVQLATGAIVAAKSVVIATGGCSVPKTGSTGDAYPWARKLGHTIVTPYPTEVPLTSKDWFIQDRTLQGLSLRDVEVTIWTAAGKRLTTEAGDLIFTHFGLSGPVALRCSHYVSTSLRKDALASLTATIDCRPTESQAEWIERFRQVRKVDAKKRVSTVMRQLLPERLADVLLIAVGSAAEQQWANVTNDAILLLAKTIKGFPVNITGTLPLAQATVTGGGVSVKDINPSTMASKRCVGLFFCGEVMDVHAHTGGYNITVAFSTGHLAGIHAAKFAQAANSADRLDQQVRN